MNERGSTFFENEEHNNFEDLDELSNLIDESYGGELHDSYYVKMKIDKFQDVIRLESQIRKHMKNIKKILQS